MWPSRSREKSENSKSSIICQRNALVFVRSMYIGWSAWNEQNGQNHSWCQTFLFCSCQVKKIWLLRRQRHVCCVRSEGEFSFAWCSNHRLNRQSRCNTKDVLLVLFSSQNRSPGQFPWRSVLILASDRESLYSSCTFVEWAFRLATDKCWYNRRNLVSEDLCLDNWKGGKPWPYQTGGLWVFSLFLSLSLCACVFCFNSTQTFCSPWNKDDSWWLLDSGFPMVIFIFLSFFLSFLKEIQILPYRCFVNSSSVASQVTPDEVLRPELPSGEIIGNEPCVLVISWEFSMYFHYRTKFQLLFAKKHPVLVHCSAWMPIKKLHRFFGSEWEAEHGTDSARRWWTSRARGTHDSRIGLAWRMVPDLGQTVRALLLTWHVSFWAAPTAKANGAAYLCRQAVVVVVGVMQSTRPPTFPLSLGKLIFCCNSAWKPSQTNPSRTKLAFKNKCPKWKVVRPQRWQAPLFLPEQLCVICQSWWS